MSADETITLSKSTTQAMGLAFVGGEVVIPRQLGSVRLVKEIGKGGMGVVWLGHDQMLGRDVAVKFLTDAIATPDDPGFARFIEGARAAAAVQHPALTAIYQAGVVEGVPHIIMHYVDGPTVSAVLKRVGRLARTDAMIILLAAADAIAVLHERNIVHRDIKPSNLLLDADGHVYVTDFGLAHRRAAAGAESSPTGGWCGTPTFMAPEMFEGEVSLRTDVYALGIMAYEMLTGVAPFSGGVLELRDKHKNQPLPEEPITAAKLSPELADLLRRATHKDAMYRYKTARQLHRALELAAGKMPDPAACAISLTRLMARFAGGAPPADESPSKGSSSTQTMYDHLSTLAAKKRGSRSGDAQASTPAQSAAGVPPAPEALCLICGQSRAKLLPDERCQGCGNVDMRQVLLQQCRDRAARPVSILLGWLTFRRPPAGWWELLREPADTRFSRQLTILLVVAATLAAGALGALFRWMTDLPTKSSQLDLKTFGPFFLYQAGWFLSLWLFYRFVWMNLMLVWRDDLDPPMRATIARAARSQIMIHSAMLLWQLLLLAPAIFIFRRTPYIAFLGFLVKFCWFALALLFPFIGWWRALLADQSGRVFPRHGLRATLLLLALVAQLLLMFFLDKASLSFFAAK